MDWFYLGAITTFAGGIQGFRDAQGVSAMFNYPHHIVYHQNDNALLVTDGFNNRIRKVTMDGNQSWTQW